jgi:hypothetical protein
MFLSKVEKVANERGRLRNVCAIQYFLIGPKKAKKKPT